MNALAGPYRIPEFPTKELEDLRKLRDAVVAWGRASKAYGWIVVTAVDQQRWELLMRAEELQEREMDADL